MSIAWEKIPIFAGLTPEALEFLAGKSQELTCPAGELVVKEGEPGNKMFIIRSGRVRVSIQNDSGQVQLAELHAPDFFGEMCILETLPRTATIQALEQTTLGSLSSIAFYQFYRAMPGQHSILVLNIARDLSRRLRRLDQAYSARC
jgi:CRP-like cAMP-binding protein